MSPESKPTTAHDAQLAYLNRKLDMQEQLIALKARELDLRERELAHRIAIEEREEERAAEAMDDLELLRERLHGAISDHGLMHAAHNPKAPRA